MLILHPHIMALHFPQESIIEFLAVLAACFTIFLISKHYKSADVKCLIFLVASAAVWAFAYGMEFAASGIDSKILWAKFSYLGISFLPVFYFCFASSFSSKLNIINKTNIGLISVIPVMTIILVFTNDFHHLIWTRTEPDWARNLVIYHYGVWFYLFWAYSILLVLYGISFLIGSIKDFSSFHKSQVIILLIATIVPFTGNILYVTRLNPIPGFDWTPVLFIISGVVIATGIFRYGMFELVPFARNKLIDTLEDGVIIINSKGIIEDCNPSVYNIFRMQNRTLTGKYFTDIFSTYKELINEINKIDPNEINLELTGNGTTNYYQARISPILNPQSMLSGHLIQIHDITRIKEGEQRLKKTNKHLRAEIKQRGKLIENLDAFAHTVAHDLRSTLSSIYSSTEIMDESIKNMDTDLFMEFSDLIKQSAKKAINITQELLILATVNNLKVEQRPLDMESVFNEARNQLKGLISEYHAVITVPSEWPVASGHAPWIEHVWTNYLTNAIKYGGRPPVIEVGADKPGKRYVRFWIKDNGNGLLPEEQKKLFKEYSRLSPEKVQGYGLGLSIVKRIIDKLDGRVGVESTGEQGKGSKFWFELSVK
jgi:PAS domain S-box-containing protein